MATPLDIALGYIARGWNPVPVDYRSKKPSAGDEWHLLRISADNAPQYFNGTQNIGVQLGTASNGLTDGDMDTKQACAIAPYFMPKTKSKFGRASARWSHYLYHSNIADIPGIGAAVTFKDPITKEMICELRIGGDGKGAQTVAPGSIHQDGEPIVWEEDGPPAKVDGNRLLQRIKVVAALALLAAHWPQAGKKARHNQALRLGGFLARCGFNEQQIMIALEAIAVATNDPEVWNRKEAGRDALRGFKNGKNTYGFPTLREDFGEPIANKVAEWLDYDPRSEREQEQADPHNEEPAEQTVFWHGEVDYHESRPYLVQSLIPEVGHGLISGQWGTIKTFAAIDLAHCLMSGEPWLGYEIMRPGGVLFVALEGADEIPIRLETVITDRGKITGPAPFAWTQTIPPLTAKNAADEICKIAEPIAKRLKAKFSVPLVLIIIDTLIAAAGYSKDGAENDAALGQAIMNTLAKVARRLRCFVFGIDHFGKAIETGTRGTSAKEASADVLIAMLGDKTVTGEMNNRRLALRKRRGGANGEEHPFTVRVVDMGLDKFGKPISSLVIDWRPSQTAQAAAPKERWSKSIRLLRQVLMTILAEVGQEHRPFADGPTVRACNLELVREEFCRRYPAEGDEKEKAHTRRQAFYRAAKTAQAASLIQIREANDSQLVWLLKPETQ